MSKEDNKDIRVNGGLKNFSDESEKNKTLDREGNIKNIRTNGFGDDLANGASTSDNLGDSLKKSSSTSFSGAKKAGEFAGGKAKNLKDAKKNNNKNNGKGEKSGIKSSNGNSKGTGGSNKKNKKSSTAGKVMSGLQRSSKGNDLGSDLAQSATTVGKSIPKIVKVVGIIASNLTWILPLLLLAMLPAIIGSWFIRDNREQAIRDLVSSRGDDDANFEYEIDEAYSELALIIETGVNSAYSSKKDEFINTATNKSKSFKGFKSLPEGVEANDGRPMMYAEAEVKDENGKVIGSSKLPVFYKEDGKWANMDPTLPSFNEERSLISITDMGNAIVYTDKIVETLADFSASIGNATPHEGNKDKLYNVVNSKHVINNMFKLEVEEHELESTRKGFEGRLYYETVEFIDNKLRLNVNHYPGGGRDYIFTGSGYKKVNNGTGNFSFDGYVFSKSKKTMGEIRKDIGEAEDPKEDNGSGTNLPIPNPGDGISPISDSKVNYSKYYVVRYNMIEGNAIPYYVNANASTPDNTTVYTRSFSPALKSAPVWDEKEEERIEIYEGVKEFKYTEHYITGQILEDRENVIGEEIFGSSVHEDASPINRDDLSDLIRPNGNLLSKENIYDKVLKEYYYEFERNYVYNNDAIENYKFNSSKDENRQKRAMRVVESLFNQINAITIPNKDEYNRFNVDDMKITVPAVGIDYLSGENMNFEFGQNISVFINNNYQLFMEAGVGNQTAKYLDFITTYNNVEKKDHPSAVAINKLFNIDDDFIKNACPEYGPEEVSVCGAPAKEYNPQATGFFGWMFKRNKDLIKKTIYIKPQYPEVKDVEKSFDGSGNYGSSSPEISPISTNNSKEDLIDPGYPEGTKEPLTVKEKRDMFIEDLKDTLEITLGQAVGEKGSDKIVNLANQEYRAKVYTGKKYASYFNTTHGKNLSEDADWNATFINWLFFNAGLSDNQNVYPFDNPTSSVSRFVDLYDKTEKYHKAGEGYVPKPGDIAVIAKGGNSINHLGLVVEYHRTNDQISIISGNEIRDGIYKEGVAHSEGESYGGKAYGYVDKKTLGLEGKAGYVIKGYISIPYPAPNKSTEAMVAALKSVYSTSIIEGHYGIIGFRGEELSELLVEIYTTNRDNVNNFVEAMDSSEYNDILEMMKNKKDAKYIEKKIKEGNLDNALRNLLRQDFSQYAQERMADEVANKLIISETDDLYKHGLDVRTKIEMLAAVRVMGENRIKSLEAFKLADKVGIVFGKGNPVPTSDTLKNSDMIWFKKLIVPDYNQVLLMTPADLSDTTVHSGTIGKGNNPSSSCGNTSNYDPSKSNSYIKVKQDGIEYFKVCGTGLDNSSSPKITTKEFQYFTRIHSAVAAYSDADFVSLNYGDISNEQFVPKSIETIRAYLVNAQAPFDLTKTRSYSKYGLRKDPIIEGSVSFHNGLDIAAPAGTPLVSMFDGVVSKVQISGGDTGWGTHIDIKHADFPQFKIKYAHMIHNRELPQGLKVGDRVSKGQIVGYIGSTGRSTGPHLHIEFYEGNQRFNPDIAFPFLHMLDGGE